MKVTWVGEQYQDCSLTDCNFRFSVTGGMVMKKNMDDIPDGKLARTSLLLQVAWTVLIALSLGMFFTLNQENLLPAGSHGLVWLFGFVGIRVSSRSIARGFREKELLQNEFVKSEVRYRHLFDQLTSAFVLQEIVFDQSGQPCSYRLLEVNPAFESLTGLKAQEIAGKTLLEVLPTIEAEVLENFLRIALSGQPAHFEYYCTAWDRSLKFSAYRPESNQVACIIEDITKRKKLEEQLRQSQKMESIGTLAGGVAHDFNNILTVIMGSAALLQRKLRNEPEQEKLVNQILSSSERAARLTHSLLAFSRKQTIQLLSLDVNDVVSLQQDFLERIIGEDVRLETAFSSERLPVFADRSQLEQVLMNLAANARDAMADGGVLRIETSRIDSRGHSAEMADCKPGQYALISISDTGSGMDKATSTRIFEPFFTTKERGQGTGLGLSMAYGIISQHNGSISVYSEPGHGTVFRIYLPLQADRSPEEVVPIRKSHPGGGETILLVEDDPHVRATNSAILESVGYNVLTAAAGQEAIDLFDRYVSRIALVILDVVMPGMNGRELCRRLRGLGCDAKILFVSGYTADILQKKGIVDEDINFTSKPLETSPFLGRVRELIDS